MTKKKLLPWYPVSSTRTTWSLFPGSLLSICTQPGRNASKRDSIQAVLGLLLLVMGASSLPYVPHHSCPLLYGDTQLNTKKYATAACWCGGSGAAALVQHYSHPIACPRTHQASYCSIPPHMVVGAPCCCLDVQELACWAPISTRALSAPVQLLWGLLDSASYAQQSPAAAEPGPLTFDSCTTDFLSGYFSSLRANCVSRVAQTTAVLQLWTCCPDAVAVGTALAAARVLAMP